MLALSLPPITVEIVDGDIAAETTDAVVNAANNHFWMGAGVAGAIKARGGAGIEREAMGQGPGDPGGCGMTGGGGGGGAARGGGGGVGRGGGAGAQGPVDPGECVMTGGGRLAARYVIHAA